MITLPGARCFRVENKIYIEIPEDAIVHVATHPMPGEPMCEVKNRDELMETLVEKLMSAERDNEDYVEQELRGFVREQIYDAAHNAMGVEFERSPDE